MTWDSEVIRSLPTAAARCTSSRTESRFILAYPEATIYHCGEHGLEAIEYEDADPVRLTRSFLEARDRLLAELLRD